MNLVKKKRILILSIISGFGHLKAALAIENALKKYNKKIEVKHINILTLLPKIYKVLYQSLYAFTTKNLPGVYSYMYHATNKYPFPNSYHHQLQSDLKQAKKILQLIYEYNPHVIVSTHFFPTNLIGEWKRQNKIQSKLISIVTDFNFHAYLMQPNSDAYIVPDISVKKQLIRYHFKNRIEQFGIPTDPLLKKKINIRLIQNKYKFNPHKKTILFMCSNYKLILIKKIFHALNKIKLPIQVIITSGRNQNLFKSLVKLKQKYSFPILPLRMTNKIYDFMKISDLIISKPGGLTVAESLVCGLPMILLNPIPGQEEKNADMLVKEKVAYKLKNTEVNKITSLIQNLFLNTAKYRQMRKNALKLGKPDASDDIAQFISTF